MSTDICPELQYACMPRPVLSDGSLRVRTVQPEHIEKIRQWRNAQIRILRQAAPITPEQQRQYYETTIWPKLAQSQPENILLAFEENNRLIGYGGLVHVHWGHRRAEISFLLDSKLAGTTKDSCHYFPRFLQLMKELAFQDLGLSRLTTETYAIRPAYLAALDGAGFAREGRLRDHVLIDNVPVDSIIHGLIASQVLASGGQRGNSRREAVLVTSASKKVPLIRAIQAASNRMPSPLRVIAADMDKDAPTNLVADDSWQLPATDRLDIEALIDGCLRRGIRIIVPTRDGELLFWANHSNTLADAGIKVVVSPPDSVHRCLDKLEFYRFGASLGWPVIPSMLAPEGADRFVAKERYGAGSRHIGLDLSRDEALSHALRLSTPVYQPFIRGREISIDAWAAINHRVKGVVLRTRDKVIDGESVVTTTFRDDAIESIAARMIELLQLRGPVVMQALIDVTGRLHVIECNSRFGGASTASIAVGLDAWYWSLMEAQGLDVASHHFDRASKEIRQVRIAADLLIHDPHL
jgi:RimJ/RimL family protein N-acetyltransferase